MQRRPARLLLALAVAAALSLGAAAAAQANAHLRSGAHAHAPTPAAWPSAAPWPAIAAPAARWKRACTARRPAPITCACWCAAATAPGTAPAPASAHRPPSPPPAKPARRSIAAVLATPCAETEVDPRPANLAVVREAVLCLINQERATHGEQPLRTNPKLQAAAESHSNECVELDYFAHVSPSGETPVERIQATGYIPSPFDGYVLGREPRLGHLRTGDPEGDRRGLDRLPAPPREHPRSPLHGNRDRRDPGRARLPRRRRPRRHLRAGVRGHHPRLEPRGAEPRSPPTSPGFATLARPEKGGGPNVV